MYKQIPACPAYPGEDRRMARADAVRDSVTIRASVPAYTVTPPDAFPGMVRRVAIWGFVFTWVLL